MLPGQHLEPGRHEAGREVLGERRGPAPEEVPPRDVVRGHGEPAGSFLEPDPGIVGGSPLDLDLLARGVVALVDDHLLAAALGHGGPERLEPGAVLDVHDQRRVAADEIEGCSERDLRPGGEEHPEAHEDRARRQQGEHGHEQDRDQAEPGSRPGPATVLHGPPRAAARSPARGRTHLTGRVALPSDVAVIQGIAVRIS